MANNNASPLFHGNMAYFDMLSDEDAGKVIKEVLRTLNGVDHTELPYGAEFVYMMMIDQCERSEEKRAKNSMAGVASGEARRRRRRDETSNNVKKEMNTVQEESNDKKIVQENRTRYESTQYESNQLNTNQVESNQEKGYCGASPTPLLAGAQDTEAYQSLPEPTRKSGNDDTKGEVCPKDSTGEKRHEIIDYLNRRMGTSYKPDSKGIKSILDPRLKDGYTVEDCKAVIDNMIMAWGSDDKMRQYIRPSTLFRPSHIDSYLNYRQTVPRAAPVLIDDEDDDIGKYF